MGESVDAQLHVVAGGRFERVVADARVFAPHKQHGLRHDFVQLHRVVARADIDIVTRRSIVGTVKVWMDDDPERITATAQGTYAIPIPK